MTYSMTISSYNGRRYGRPWAAKITAFTGSATLEFCKYPYNGDDNGGELVIDAEPGDVIKLGQKDYRSNKSYNDFYFCSEDGKLQHIESPVDARARWIQHHTA